MKRALLIALLGFVGAAVPQIAAAQDCQYHNIRVDFASGQYVEPIDPAYDECYEVEKVRGTLKGTYLVCYSLDDFIPSDDIYGDGITSIEASKYHSWISTRRGDIELMEWSWFDYEGNLETGILKPVGGTGDFDGATGSLSWTPRYPNVADPDVDPVYRFEGYICTP